MVEINGQNFNREVLDSEKVVLVDFWAPWCVPCKVIAPTVEKIAHEHRDRVKVAKANVDDNPDLATALSIFNIPTLVFFKSGKEHSRLIGVNTKEAIEAKIEKITNEG
ncbi:MAG: thioredoxin [Omnitrophica bacterium RIFCSPLOWO2_01_FULL_45_24]|nr:MAG: thioredoxin [Omnitrophica bacterium RIFCSPHIGHO2_02_FULL_46_20]OGW95001.1 MAG: thioredoxin [Omnitrophica bacterium RIFCSPLOWO2_01_FULL_45_24]